MTAPAFRASLVAWAVAATGLTVVIVSLVAERPVGGDVQWRDAFLGFATLVVGARIASHAPGNSYGWLLLGVGLLAALAAGTSLATVGPGLSVRTWASYPSYALLALTCFYFPDGRLPSPRWRISVLVLGLGLGYGFVGLIALGWRSPQELLAGERVSPGWDTDAARIGLIFLLVAAPVALVSVVMRIRRTDPGRRRPLIWGAISTVLLVVGSLLEMVDVPLVAILAALAFPAATVVAILRYGLYDIDTVIHRSLLYGILASALVGVYALLAAFVVRLFPAEGAPVVAAAVALLALPLRDWLQRLIDRRVYGQSGSPYELLTALARGVGRALTPGDMLTEVVERVAEGLRVPYVAVLLEPGDQPERSAGTRRPWPVASLELVHRGATIGHLVVQQRAPDEPWLPRERRLLKALALQIAAPAAAVRLIRDLQHTRERLVTMREEERRRLRRDLHDGVGPVLSGARMQLRALSATLDTDERAVRALEDDLGLASDELRRAIDGLRPPALDRGLVPALTGLVNRHVQSGLQIDVAIDDRLEGVPAAAEVALYRVLDEALANCVRHAEATHARVEIRRTAEELTLIVRDDGRGYVGPRDGGVGTESMRQRCEELGGALTIEPDSLHGTVLTATFPCGEPG